MKLFSKSSHLFGEALSVASAPSLAQQANCGPGSPCATTTMDGKQLPPPPQEFEGKIGRNAAQSTPSLLRNPRLYQRCMVRIGLTLLVAGLSGCGSGGSGPISGPPIGGDSPTIATVQIDPSATAQAISPNFMGIAQDIAETSDLVGTATCNETCTSNMNPIYKQLIGNLVLYGNGPMLIRLLGDIGDSSDPDHYDRPHLAPLWQLHQDLGVRFFAGVDFKDNDTQTAHDEAAALVAVLPGDALQGIELGNEPDLYKPPVRDSGWDYNEYLAEYPAFASAILAASGGVKLAAPVWSSSVKYGFMPSLNDFVTSAEVPTPTLSMVVIHHYSGNPGERPDYLLTQAAVCGDTQPYSGPGGCQGQIGDVRQYVPTAQQYGLPLRIGELNSINNKGQDGVSNSFSSALWAMDISFAYAQDGVSGVNFFNAHSNPNDLHYYSPFDFTYSGGKYSVHDINPLYYGMLMFAQAVQSSAQLLPITLSQNGTIIYNITAWATIDSGNTIRLLLLNKDVNASGNVTVSLTGYGNATITRLMAPLYSSKKGLTIGCLEDGQPAGQTFDGTPDGTLQGIPCSETVEPVDGVYTVSLPNVGAALVTIEPEPGVQ